MSVPLRLFSSSVSCQVGVTGIDIVSPQVPQRNLTSLPSPPLPPHTCQLSSNRSSAEQYVLAWLFTQFCRSLTKSCDWTRFTTLWMASSWWRCSRVLSCTQHSGCGCEATLFEKNEGCCMLSRPSPKECSLRTAWFRQGIMNF